MGSNRRLLYLMKSLSLYHNTVAQIPKLMSLLPKLWTCYKGQNAPTLPLSAFFLVPIISASLYFIEDASTTRCGSFHSQWPILWCQLFVAYLISAYSKHLILQVQGPTTYVSLYLQCPENSIWVTEWL